MFASLEFAFHLPVRKLSVFSLMLIMLLLAGCGSGDVIPDWCTAAQWDNGRGPYPQCPLTKP